MVSTSVTIRSSNLTLSRRGKKTRRWLMTLFIGFVTWIAITPHVHCSPVSRPEVSDYVIKAAYIFRFLYFIEWPKTASKKNENTITIGVVGSYQFVNAFKPVEGKPVNNKKVVIKKFNKGTKDISLLTCQVLFINNSEKYNMDEILSVLNGHPVLTVGDFEGFIDNGGMINFVEEGKNIRFEINNISIDRAGIEVRSVLKRQAIRAIGGVDVPY